MMEISPHQWEKVKALFDAALESTPPVRSTLIQGEQDEVVRKEVMRLLVEHEEIHSFLSTPPYADARVSALRPESRFESGVLAGRFQIIGFVAAGGMGEVYRAEDLVLSRTVALKFLPKEQSADHASLERLRSEAKAASSLNHPNICTVYDFGEGAGRAFIAMEFLEGETLSARLRRGPVPVAEALKIAIPIASALGAAHRKGIIHRDLKPGNIMLAETGVKLLDFGLARKSRQNSPDAETASLLTDTAQIVGTLPYMSPELLRREDMDARGDIFACGAVLYEMLTGVKAFQRRSSSDTISAVLHEEPRPLRELTKDVPVDLEAIVTRCLRKQSEERYATMQEIEQALEECRWRTAPAGVTLGLLWQHCKRPAIATPLLVIFILLAVLGAWSFHHNARVRWARYEALPRIAQLIDAEKVDEAYALAVQAEKYIPSDPVLVKSWNDIAYTSSIHTTPPGASVYRKSYAGQGEWEFVGISPIEKGRFPGVASRWKFELSGYAPVERATFFELPDFWTVAMTEQEKAPDGMVHVTIQDSGSTKGMPVNLFLLPGFADLPSVVLEDYWIDKYEVTNRQYKAFLDAGGYQNQSYWEQEFRKDGRLLSWHEAMALFRDATGRPGPATWEQGEYPSGQDDYPVTGVSWFEAAAYAKFAGKSLPTIYHWKTAASTRASQTIIPASNFSGRGPVRVGSYQGVSDYGAYDMAGNAKEWIWNYGISGKRYILGGAWNDPDYMFYTADGRSPFDRLATFGFRCAKYTLSGESTKAAVTVDPEMRDYAKEKPVSDEIFKAYKRLYSYDKTPLNAKLESIPATHNNSTLEKITFDAAYGKERMTAYLYLPRNGSPPFQTVIYVPAGGALAQEPFANNTQHENFEFVLKSGRAVLYTVYKGTYERADGFRPSVRKDSNDYRDHVIYWSKDLGRSIDYLETRSDIDAHKLAYFGFSWGAALGAILPAVEPRIKASLLWSAGFYLQRSTPEVDQINFAPRVTAPTLMISGRYDYLNPTNSSQEPMFRLLGTRKQDKRRILLDTGHDLSINPTVKESLDWLDRYLGPVH